VKEKFISLSLNEIHSLMTALQFLSVKEQSLIEDTEQVKLPALYNKLVSIAGDIYCN
jgi:hypothetical protein